MKSKVYLYPFIFASVLGWLLVAGCGSGSSGAGRASNSDATGIVNLRPGTLAMSQMNGLSKPVFKNVTSATITTFDLGTIKASRDFYFILSNTGDVSVTDVVITSLNDNFTVSPNMVDNIYPQKSSNMIPIIRVTAKHGIALDGTGYTNSLLPMGNNTCTLQISGKTKDKDDDIDIVLTVKIKVYAEVFDVLVMDNNNEISPIGYEQDLYAVETPTYDCKQPTIKNTGNVDITVVTRAPSLNEGGSWPILEQFSLHPSEIHQLSYPVFNRYKELEVELYGDNTITNYSRLQPRPDGSVHMIFDTYVGGNI